MMRALAFALAFLAAPALAQPEAVKGVPLLQTPGYAESEGAAMTVARTGDVAAARRMMQGLAARYPNAPRPRLVDARLAIASGDREGSIAAIEAAASLGAPGLDRLLNAPAFDNVAGDPRIVAARSRAEPPTPPLSAKPTLAPKGEALVRADILGWDQQLVRLTASFAPPPSAKGLPAFDRPKGPLVGLQRLIRRGAAAGSHGDLYDNRDADHSNIRRRKPTQLTYVEYDEAAKKAGLHYGLNERLLFDGIVFGNSSTALKGAVWRSQPRHALTTPFGPRRLWQLYAHNHIYVFPEHRDHDPEDAKNGHGDVFPANTPYYIVSQGSSGSDIRHLTAIQAILAAMKPDVKSFLKEEKLIAPTVQRVYRAGRKGVTSDDAYLSTAAHPTAFDGKDIDLARMIEHAQRLRKDAVPPFARISMVEEARPDAPFASPVSEALFTTPAAIARLWRGGEGSRSYKLSAAGSRDPNGRPLTYFWRVLRGDPKKVRISRAAPDASEVTVDIDWTRETRSPRGLASSRIDIGLFAFNGVEYSAPAFFSLGLPSHEKRVFDEDGRLVRVGYDVKPKDRYFDPVLWPLRRWSDVFDYDAEGRLIGWTREHNRQPAARYTRHGHLVEELDELGRPSVAVGVDYRVTRQPKGRSLIEAAPNGRRFAYAYAGPDDQLGGVRELR